MVSCEKTAVPIKMSFGMKTRAGARNHVLEGRRDIPRERALLMESRSHRKGWQW